MSIDRDRLRKLSDAATPGPWEFEWDQEKGTLEVVAGTARKQPNTNRDAWYKISDVLLYAEDVFDDEEYAQLRAADAEFIADSREAIPALLDALNKAEYEREQAEARLLAVRAVLDSPIRLRDWDEAFAPASHILRALDGDVGA